MRRVTSTGMSWSFPSFQLEATAAFPVHIAVVLNVTPDHLDRHGTLEAYAKAKGKIFQAQTATDHAVLHFDDPACRTFALQTAGTVNWFSRTGRNEPGAWVENGYVLLNGQPVTALPLLIPGHHNLENALAAVTASSLAGIGLEAMAKGLQTFRTAEHRLECVAKISGVAYYNDSKATNVDAAIKAVETFDRGLWVILGGSEKGFSYTALRRPLRDRARGVLLIGESAPRIERELNGAVPLIHAGTLLEAMQYAHRHAESGDTVLLSPACASFDQFKNYGERGRRFKEIVRELREKAEASL